MNICKRCGYSWESIRDDPKCCPNCKSYKWYKEDKTNFIAPKALIKEEEIKKIDG